MTPQTQGLVEHFFRHEFGRLVSLLVRALGIRHLQLAEDVVQTALARALETWARRGIPAEPAAWLYRTAKNLALDELRRTAGTQSIAGEPLATSIVSRDAISFPDEISDEPLRLLFVCCHESVPAESKIALALKTVCGFGVREIARAFLSNEETIQKRIERARQHLRDVVEDLELPASNSLAGRIEAVRSTIYLMFSEGCYASHGDQKIRLDLCLEARRLISMLANHPVGAEPTTFALAALICFHSARLKTRMAADHVVLLNEQDREQWNWHDIREGMNWLAKAAAGAALSRYHLEAAIAWEHCRASNLQTTDWAQISKFYRVLDCLSPSPITALNGAIAEAYLNGPAAGLAVLSQLKDRFPERNPGWHAVAGELQFRMGNHRSAEEHWCQALARTANRVDQDFIRGKIADCRAMNPPITRAP